MGKGGKARRGGTRRLKEGEQGGQGVVVVPLWFRSVAERMQCDESPSTE